MAAPGGDSAACCSIPPIVAKGYQELGKYETIGGLKTYVTGPETATAGILLIYDIFGFASQTLQGADILATSDKHHQYKVFIPDFLHGEYAQKVWFASDEGKKVHLPNWFKTHGPPTAIKQIPDTLKSLNKSYNKIDKWGCIGFCWGGKAVTLTSTEGTPWKAAAQVHPAMLNPDDATNVIVPFLSIASKDESTKDHAEFADNLKVEKRIETFHDQIHGFMTARADLETQRNREEYERGYKILLEFFAVYL
ncbi:hypothetical protein V491_01711 [Pseudogymnoascus sp. VKM F-3775]|nr:hypothetical protein V491_01711 [Pseudogymnoascus sp. VKM F-3775]